MNTTAAIKAYAKVGIESGVNAADPHKLISLLYEGALQAIANARNDILNKDISAKGKAISKALAILDEGLLASLDKKAGGDLAQNLAALYEYMLMRLIAANLKNDVTALDEVARLLTDLKEAWDSIRPAITAPAAAPITAPQPSAANHVQQAYGRS